MNLGDMRSRLRAAIGNPALLEVTDSTLNQCVNDGYVQLESEFAFRATRKRASFTTVAGTDQYQLPNDCFAVRRVRDRTNGLRLTKRGDAWLYEQPIVVPGKPTDYVQGPTYIQLWPPPDDAYSVELLYSIHVARLVGDGDVPVLPDHWHPGIVMLARWTYYDLIKPDYAKAVYALNMYKDWSSRIATDIEEEKDDVDSGVEVPTLAQNLIPRLDFDHSP